MPVIGGSTAGNRWNWLTQPRAGDFCVPVTNWDPSDPGRRPGISLPPIPGRADAGSLHMSRVPAPYLALVVAVVGVAIVTGAIGYLAISLADTTPADPESPSPADSDVEEAIVAAHSNDITGENVTVGVLDVTGFDSDRDRLDGRVVDARAFGPDAPAVDGGDPHGTAAATTVVRVAPDADLYLGTFATPEGFSAGLGWMIDNDVDVVLAPVAATDSMGDGSGALSRISANAVDRGTVVVAPTGNAAAGHWTGEYDPGPEGRHLFSGGPLNELGTTGDKPDAELRRAEFTLAWSEPGDAYTLELHRLTEDGTDLVAQSVREDGTSSRLVTPVDPDERYAVAVDGPEEDADATLRITSTTHSLVSNESSGSIAAPAAAPGVIAVGATDPATGELEPFSGRGPTPDGRPGVDVVAPHEQPVPETGDRFVGTSASAAFVAGVTALVVDADPSLEPLAVRWRLVSTAGDDDPPEGTVGHGRIDPWTAIDVAAGGDLDPPETADAEERSGDE